MKPSINKILIPTDYSVVGIRATHFGLNLAKMTGAEVILFHSYHVPGSNYDMILDVKAMTEEQAQKMNLAKEELQLKYPELSITSVVEFGSVVDNLLSLCEKEQIDLVVMGTKGETNSLDAVLGSVSSNVVNVVKCAVLLIPEEVYLVNISEVMLATDFHPTKSTKYFNPLLTILNKTGASLSIVNVRKQLEVGELPSRFETQIDEIFGSYKHSHHFLESDNTEEALFDFANIHHTDLIVLTTKHYSLWERIWHRSLTKRMALHCNKAMLILHKDA